MAGQDVADVLLETADNGDITWTNPPTGEPQVFCRSAFPTLAFEVTELSVSKRWDSRSEDTEKGPLTLSTQLNGTARLPSTSIQVLGFPGTLTRELDVTFEVHSEAYRELHRHLYKDEPSQVSLGYMGGDRETGVKPQWYISVGLQQAELDALIQQLTVAASRCTLRISVPGLYRSTWARHAPVALKADDYIPSSDSTKPAGRLNGWLDTIWLHGTTLPLPAGPTTYAGGQDDESQTDDKQPIEVRQPLSSEQPGSTQALEKIHKALLFIGWALLGLAAVLVAK